jgi:hypothetical protein
MERSSEKPREDVRGRLVGEMRRMGAIDEVVMLPGRGGESPARIRSPRLARPEQVAFFAKQQINPPIDL